MAELDYISVKEPYEGSPAAVGDGVADDTFAIQNRIDILYLKYASPTTPDDGRALFFPWGKYRTTGKLVVRDRIRLVGQGYAGQSTSDGGAAPSVLYFDHTDTGMEIVGPYVQVENLVFRGRAAEGDAIAGINATEVPGQVGGDHSRIERCRFLRQGGKAAVRIRLGGGVFSHNWIMTHHNPTQWSYNAGAMAPDRGHALWCPGLVDHEISSNQMASEGAGLFLESCGGLNIHDNFIFNSNVGIYMAGTSRCSIADNRCEEHCREGLVVDWNSCGNTITGNRFHNNGARITEATTDRVGILLRSGASNVIANNAFDNWDHDDPPPADISYMSPQQYGLRVKPAGTADTNAQRRWPRYNSVSSNTFREQKAGSILNDFPGDATNKFRDNVGPDFPGGVLASYSTPSGERPLPAAALGPAALAAGLMAFRNRREPALDAAPSSARGRRRWRRR